MDVDSYLKDLINNPLFLMGLGMSGTPRDPAAGMFRGVLASQQAQQSRSIDAYRQAQLASQQEDEKLRRQALGLNVLKLQQEDARQRDARAALGNLNAGGTGSNPLMTPDVIAYLQANPDAAPQLLPKLLEQKQPNLITGVGPGGQPVRVPDVAGTSVYQSPKDPKLVWGLDSSGNAVRMPDSPGIRKPDVPGITMETLPGGGTRMIVGATKSPTGLTTGAMTEIQKSITDLERARTMGEQSLQMFNPEYHTGWNQDWAKGIEFAQKRAPGLTPDDWTKWKTGYDTYMQTLITGFNANLRAVSGLNVTKYEMPRVEQEMIHPDDSPQRAFAKGVNGIRLNAIITDRLKSLASGKYADLDEAARKYPLPSTNEALLRTYTLLLIKGYREQGMAPEQFMPAIDARLRREKEMLGE